LRIWAARRSGIGERLIAYRIKAGWPPERLFLPADLRAAALGNKHCVGRLLSSETKAKIRAKALEREARRRAAREIGTAVLAAMKGIS
jgi:hypothetical protein